MESQLPSVTIIIPAYNSQRTLGDCLASIFGQDYPKEKLEVLVLDGGSKDATIDIASGYSKVNVLHNPLRTAEAGKAIGARNSSSDILAFIDSDNLLPSAGWLKEMIRPFLEDSRIVGTEPLYYVYRTQDPSIVRYGALMGMNYVYPFFLGNYDRFNYIKARWTDLRVPQQDRGTYLLVELAADRIPTIGANGFLVRRKFLSRGKQFGYMFDVDLVYNLVQLGHNKYAKVKVGIIHVFARNFAENVRKTNIRAFEYFLYKRRGMRSYPWQQFARNAMPRLLLNAILVFPLLYQTKKGVHRLNDRAWLLHPFVVWFTICIYAAEAIRMYLPVRIRGSSS
jgi:glycosyltransferase involved in cell wall biosynthesis